MEYVYLVLESENDYTNPGVRSIHRTLESAQKAKTEYTIKDANSNCPMWTYEIEKRQVLD